jgi:hypothetical protein
MIGYFADPTGVTIQFDPVKFVILAFISVALIPVQTATEEIIFRGYLLQGISQTTWRVPWPLRIVMGNNNPDLLQNMDRYYAGISEKIFRNGIVPLIITSFLFGWLHMSNPEARAHGWMVMLPYYASFALFLGAITLIDEGLELAIGVHCANNLISGLLVTSPNTVLKTDAIFVVANENPGGELLQWLVMATITFIIFWRKYRWKNFNLLIK